MSRNLFKSATLGTKISQPKPSRINAIPVQPRSTSALWGVLTPSQLWKFAKKHFLVDKIHSIGHRYKPLITLRPYLTRIFTRSHILNRKCNFIKCSHNRPCSHGKHFFVQYMNIFDFLIYMNINIECVVFYF